MTANDIRSQIQKDKVDYILVQYVDIHGTPRCKGVPARALDLFLEGSAGFAGAAVSGMGQGPHDHDMIAMPDLESYTLVPWETGVARFACNITVDGNPWPYCPRTALRRATAELARDGYVMMVGAEAEHFLVRRREDGSIVPFDPDGVDTMDKPCYDFKSLAGSMGYLRTLLTYLEQLGWEPYASDHEDGTAQFEINWKYSDALTTADRFTFYKMMTSQVAKRFGATATHMPKPFAHLTGSGTHFHISLWDPAKQRNLFLDQEDRRNLGLSSLAYQFLAGLIEHARALTAVVAPTVNDYKRLSVGEFLTGVTSGFTWTPAFISYGDNNRTQMFRVPEPGRFEARLVSGSVNPYLGMAAFVAAGLDGIRRKLEPGEPNVRKNMYALTLDEVKRGKIGLIPQSLAEAITCFEADPIIQQALGPELSEEFVKVKRQEWVRYHNAVSRWEIDRYLTLF
ncbi:MAG: type III glutamate--ammonia ligase [Candidatus Rokuibacteriota bacterium]|nr:MAG: type III glutamate--ammonia ligase [Candidatus Rokubacteria bacterium]